MKSLLILALVLSFSGLRAEETLKNEVTKHLEVVIKNSKGVPPDGTAEELYEALAEEIDFTLNEEQVKQLEDGKTLYTQAQYQALLKRVEDYRELKSPVFTASLEDALQDDGNSARERESAFRLLDSFNDQKLKRLLVINVNRARLLYILQLEEGAEVKQDDDMHFQGLKGTRPWLFKPDGFGKLHDFDMSKVIILSPESLMGKLVLGCEDGSVKVKTVEEVKGVMDLSEVEMPEAKP